jgi:pyruvate dehydrogenase (quinone)
MGKRKVADLLVDPLVARGVGRIDGVSGDSLNGITDAVRRHDQLAWIPVRHEETCRPS